jgi:Flp pilus assembly protein TadG
VWDLAEIAMAKAQIEEGLQDAVTYIAAGNTDSAGITAAAQNAYGKSTTVSTSTVCYCVPTGTTTPTAPTSVACGGSCGSGNALQTFMSVTVSASVTLPVPLPYLSSPAPVASTGQVRTG